MKPHFHFDLVGMGANATDTVIIVPHYPEYNTKMAYLEERTKAGGNVATAVIACQKLGKRCKYIGVVGDDERARFQIESLRCTGVDISDVQEISGCPNQSAYILIDRRTGERTVLWYRHPRLVLQPEMLSREQVCAGRMLHVDGHDVGSTSLAASWAQQAGIPVTCDMDTLRDDVDRLLQYVDYFICSATFPKRYTGEHDPFKALEILRGKFRLQVAAMTLGADGVLALSESGYLYRPAYEVDPVDTTGAGDVFHGAFCYTLLEGWPLEQMLDFSCAVASLSCTKFGARGGIPALSEALALMQGAPRKVNREYMVR